MIHQRPNRKPCNTTATPPPTQGEIYDTFKSYAAKTEDVVFVQTTSADVAKAAGLDAVDTVSVVKNFAGEHGGQAGGGRRAGVKERWAEWEGEVEEAGRGGKRGGVETTEGRRGNGRRTSGALKP